MRKAMRHTAVQKYSTVQQKQRSESCENYTNTTSAPRVDRAHVFTVYLLFDREAMWRDKHTHTYMNDYIYNAETTSGTINIECFVTAVCAHDIHKIETDPRQQIAWKSAWPPRLRYGRRAGLNRVEGLLT